MELKTLAHYERLAKALRNEPPVDVLRYLLRTDLFFLVWFGCGRADIFNKWFLARAKEVQKSPNGHIDLWAREHGKSTMITFGQTIQDILSSHGENPDPKWNGREVTIGIFSYTKTLATGFLRNIKSEFENNDLLKSVFPDIIWENPRRDAPTWSDNGILLRRKSNPKEATVEAWGLIRGMPTGRHFVGLVYDDVITYECVKTPHMLQEAMNAWELSIALGSRNGFMRIIGTRYHYGDAYGVIIKRKSAKPRVHPATRGGKPDGKPAYLTKKELEKKKKAMGNFNFSAQMLLDPVANDAQAFNREWLKYHECGSADGMNVYITVDPANQKKKTSDYTVMMVIGLGHDQNYYILDIVRDRLNLTERSQRLFDLHRRWRPINVGYERYGIQADIEHIKSEMSRNNYHFNIIELGGQLTKEDRIRQLIPDFENNRVYLPSSLHRTDYEGKTHDLATVFIEEEYCSFPLCVHDDMLDALARIKDKALGTLFPREYVQPQRYSGHKTTNSGWAN